MHAFVLNFYAEGQAAQQGSNLCYVFFFFAVEFPKSIKFHSMFSNKFHLLRLIAARAKKLVNNSINATPQPTEHRSTARRNSGVSQSQRKYPKSG